MPSQPSFPAPAAAIALPSPPRTPPLAKASPNPSTSLPLSNPQITLMTTARSLTSFSPSIITSLIHGPPALLTARRAAWSRVEAALSPTPSTPSACPPLPSHYAHTSREDLYLDGLRMGAAAWEDMATHGHRFFEWITPRYTLFNYSPLGMARTLFQGTVEMLGTEGQREKWAEGVKRGEINGVYAQTELGHGSFVRGVETTATWVEGDSKWGSGFVITSPTVTSTKFWPGGMGFSGTHAVVMAQLVIRGVGYGVHAFVVELRDRETGKAMPGIELGDLGGKMSYNQNDNGYARFEGVRIPRGNMLMGLVEVTEKGEYKRREGVHKKAEYGGMLVGRANIPRACAMQLAAAVTIATRYSTVRQQGYSPFAAGESSTPAGETAIFRYRSQHFQLLVQLSKAYAILFASRHGEKAFQKFISQQHRQDFSTMTETHILLSGIKAWATTTASEGAEDARKTCGGSGYLIISGLPEIVQSVTVLCTVEGENSVLWQQVARYLVKWAPKLSGPSSVSHIPEDLSYLAAPTNEACTARDIDFLDPSIQLSIFQQGSQRLIAKASQMLQKSLLDSVPPVQAWDRHVMLLISMARTHIEYIVLRSFIDITEAMSGSPEKTVMRRVRSLFALSTIVDSTSPLANTLLEGRFLSEAQVDDIRAQINNLLDALVPDAIGLTDAWDFTDAGLASAIGMRNGDVYTMLMSWTRQLPINVAERETPEVEMKRWEEYIKPALRSRL